MSTHTNPNPFPIIFIGAGPGDPELLTLKAARLIREADLILYAGSLVNPAVLQHARPQARIHNTATLTLDEQIELMAQAAQQGQRVIRLHTGDPTLYGATLEQMRRLQDLGLGYEVAPGVSSVFAATAALKTELTAPGGVQTVILSRAAGRTPVPERENLADLARHQASLVLFLSIASIKKVVRQLQEGGYPPETPVAVVYRASWPDERILRGTLADIAQQVQDAGITKQALIIVSPVLAGSDGRSHLYGQASTESRKQPPRAGMGILALTRGGVELGQRLLNVYSDAILYAPARHLPDVASLPPNVMPFTQGARQAMTHAWKRHRSLVGIAATGALVRLLKPLLRSKEDDPAVVALDERGRFAISLLSGHRGGANALAREIAGLLGGEAVITTSSDVQNLPAADLLGQERGWKLAGKQHVVAVSAALVNGQAVGVVWEEEEAEPLPFAAPHISRYPDVDALRAARPTAGIIISHRRIDLESFDFPAILYHPPTLAVGVGCNRGVSADEIVASIRAAFDEAGLALESVALAATVEDKADEQGLVRALRHELGWPLEVFRREALRQVPAAILPNPSAAAQKHLGVPGVAEPAALLAANARRLVLPKRRFENVTVAVARGSEAALQRGEIRVVGLGPGDAAHITPAARQAIESADVIIGYKTYLNLIQHLAPHTPRIRGRMTEEVARAQHALALAQEGQRVAVVSSGDPGVYAMAGLVLELVEASSSHVQVQVIPGITAGNSAAALLGAPLAHDYATISLSDLLTPLDVILQRVEAAAASDMVIAFYNPRSRKRVQPLLRALEILRRHRRPETPVGVVKSAYRAKERVILTTLAQLDVEELGMLSTIIVGNSDTFISRGRMITPRGYHSKYDFSLLLR
jgi:precorrin-4 C11-methyltransferase